MARLDADGRIWYPTSEGGSFNTSKRPQLKRYLGEMAGGVMGTVWTDIPPINSQAQERLGYPTQKPEAFLERIVRASSNEGDTLLDPFCGCGTAISVAERLDRKWIGIDVTHLATTLIKHRLHVAFRHQLSPFEEHGSPPDMAGALALAKLDRYQFEWWALGLVGARPAHDKKKGADKGVDGHIYFYSDLTGEVRKAVKSGHVTRSMIGDLNSARQREKAEMAVFITLEKSKKPMLDEATAAGFYRPPEQPNHRIPRMQILTIEDLLVGGKQPELPRLAQMQTFKKPPRVYKGKPAEQAGLFEKLRA
jgi:site-specific DNA-methyltransferase (adenine-specific)